MGMTPSDHSRGSRGDMRSNLGAPTGDTTPAMREWPITQIDEDGGNGPAAPVEKYPHFTPEQFAIAVKLFANLNRDLFNTDPYKFFDATNNSFYKATSKLKSVRREAAPFTPPIIVAGVVELLRQDLADFIQNGSYSRPEQYKRPAAIVISVCKDTIATVGRAENADLTHWAIEQGLLQRFVLSARVLNPPAHRELYGNALTHTNHAQRHLIDKWEDAGLLSVLGQEFAIHCRETHVDIRSIVEQTYAVSQGFRAPIRSPSRDPFGASAEHALANFLHKAAIAEQNRQEEQQRLDRIAQLENQLGLFD